MATASSTPRWTPARFLCQFSSSFRPPIVRAGRALICAVFVYGLFTVLFGVSREFVLSVACYALIGAADEISVIMRNMTIQLATPDELRGRVGAVNSVFIGASNQMGAMESGFLAALTSATTAVVTGGDRRHGRARAGRLAHA